MSAQMTLEEYERITPILSVPWGEEKVIYCTPNRPTAWRVQTFFTKEPETIEWIGGFTRGDVLVDIGANVGMYTIWAAKTMGVRVFAFEPESQNFGLLAKNIAVNGLGKTVIAYPVAISDEARFDVLHLSALEVGQSCHSFGESVDFSLQPHEFPLAQGSVSVTLDELVAKGTVPVPRHIKVDVDGLEHKVVAGAAETLAKPEVASMLIEINGAVPEHVAIVERMGALGFTYAAEQVALSKRTEGAFKGVANYVFRR